MNWPSHPRVAVIDDGPAKPGGPRSSRGGVRVVYYLKSLQGEIWMFTVHATHEEASIPGHVVKKIKAEVDGGG